MAANTRRSLARPRSLSGLKNFSEGTPRQAPWSCHGSAILGWGTLCSGTRGWAVRGWACRGPVAGGWAVGEWAVGSWAAGG
ncbi:hypothetical protein GCM10010483_68580 [Actinokineospora diospyrosa]